MDPLHQRLVAPWPQLATRYEDAPRPTSVVGAFHQIDGLVEHCGRMLRVVLADEGDRQVRQDDRPVLRLAHPEAPRGCLQDWLRPLRVAQMQVVDAGEPAKLL